MPRICYFSGSKTKSGNNRSHSMRATKRTFKTNLLTKKMDLGDGMMTTVKISARMYKKMKSSM